MGLMKNCKETSLLVTRSMDHKLGWTDRLGMRIHLAVCDNCARFMKQMQLLRAWLHSEEDSSQPGLTEESRERIARKLQERE